MIVDLPAPPSIGEIDVMSPEFQATLYDVGTYLVENALTGGVLHSHFLVRPAEALLKTFSPDGQAETAAVVSRGQVSDRQEVTWRFRPKTGLWVATEWSADIGIGEVDVTSRAFRAVLAEVGAFLAAKDLTGVVCVGLLDPRFLAGSDGAWLETTNRAARTQLTRLVRYDQVHPRQASVWRFVHDGGRVRPIAMKWCDDDNVAHN